jgi:hypothetical protein
MGVSVLLYLSPFAQSFFQVYGERYQRKEKKVLFETQITFVCVNDEGDKAPILPT